MNEHKCLNINIYDEIYGNIYYKFNLESDIRISMITMGSINYYEINILNPRNIKIEYQIN